MSVIIVNVSQLGSGRTLIDVYENGEHQELLLSPRALASLTATLRQQAGHASLTQEPASTS